MAGLAAGAGCTLWEAPAPAGDGEPKVGAYYYVWYDRKEWEKGYLGNLLDPPVRPLLGEYASGDSAVAAQHIRWATEHGIDFFVVGWAGPRSPEDAYLRAGLLTAPNLNDTRFAILYESLLAIGTREFHVDFTDAVIARLLADVEYLAGQYLSHPRYLRVDGRPVLFLYVARNYHGKYREALAALRAALARRGHQVYLVGDEVFWHEPRRRRLRLYDAVTAYNMYDWPRTQFSGFADRSRYFEEVRAQYRSYKLAAAEAGTAFIPAVMPGYNDRAVRPAPNQYVIPRGLAPEGPADGFFARGLAELGRELLDDRTPFLMVTTFNEWHEWSQIEPTQPGPETTEDTSGRQRFTLGYPHDGYGFRYLETLRGALVAVSGRVLAATGERAAPGREVRALRDGQLAAATVADGSGHFRFSRWRLPPGRYQLVAGRGAPVTVEVGPGWTGPVELRSE